MKKLIYLPLLTLVILVVSCSKSETTDPATDLTTQNNMVSTGDWKVTQYLDSGIDETSDFSGLNFSFNTDGTIVASSTTASFTGTWSLASQTGSDDPATDDKFHKFTIDVAGDKLMNKVSKKWLAEKVTATEIWLRDDNVLSNETLRFGK